MHLFSHSSSIGLHYGGQLLNVTFSISSAVIGGQALI